MAAVMRIIAALLSGAMLAQAQSLEPIWQVAWAAPMPLLIALSGASWSGALILGAIAGAGSTVLMLSYSYNLGGVADVAILLVLKTSVWMVAASCHRAAMRGLPAWLGVLAFPASMAGVETLISIVSSHGSSGAFAYSQIEFLPAVQIASLGGGPAITFVVCLFASGLAAMIAHRNWIAAVAPVVVVAGLLVWGALRIPPLPKPAPGDLGVALLAHDSFAFDASNWRVAWEAYAAEAEQSAKAGANVIVFPEKVVTLTAGETQQALRRLQTIAAERGVVIVAGAVAAEKHFSYNRAWFISPAGVRSYNKRHLVPGAEAGLQRGVADLYTDVGGIRMGIAIGKDMDFPALGRRFGSYGAMLVVAPAWDLGADAWLHSRMAMLRAVEGGFWMARSGREGLMLVSDPYGRVIAQQRSKADMSRLAALIPLQKTSRTIYVLTGDAFGWACLAIGLGLTAASLVFANRRNSEPKARRFRRPKSRSVKAVQGSGRRRIDIA
jgi:apolipoprotein N-acyltransferase